MHRHPRTLRRAAAQRFSRRLGLGAARSDRRATARAAGVPARPRIVAVLDCQLRAPVARNLSLMTRVLVIEAAGNLWGSERSLLDMISGTQGIEVTVCCPPGRPLLAELEKRGIRSIPTFVY